MASREYTFFFKDANRKNATNPPSAHPIGSLARCDRPGSGLLAVFGLLARSLSSAVKRHCQLYFSNLSVLLTTLSEAQRESSGKPKDALVTRRPSLSAPCTGAHGAPQTHGGSCSLWFDEYISRARANHSMIDVAAHTCLC